MTTNGEHVDYTLGVDITNRIATGFGVLALITAASLLVMFFVAGTKWVFSNGFRVGPALALLLLLILICVPVAGLALLGYAAVWGAVYASINLVMNLRHGEVVQILAADVANGTFALRVVSVTVPIVLLVGVRGNVHSLLPLGLAAIPLFHWPKLLYKSLRRHTAGVSPGDNKTRDQRTSRFDKQEMFVQIEGFLYLAATSCLWYDLMRNGALTAIGLLLSFVLVFIIDDWVILAHYRVDLQGDIPWAHRLRLIIAILAVGVLMIAEFFFVFSLLVASLLTVLVVTLFAVLASHKKWVT